MYTTPLKIHNSSTSIDTSQSARNLGFIFDKHISFSDHISALSKSCYHHIRALRCIRSYIDLHTNKTIATSIVHSKLDYCNSLYYGFPKYQINRLQYIQNALAQTVVQAPKFQHITPILKSLHWLKVSERIEYNIISVLQNSQYHSAIVSLWPRNLFSLLAVIIHALLRIPHPNYSSPSQRPSFEHTGLTCYILLSPFHHFLIVSLWAQNLPFQKILSSTLVYFCLSDWSHGYRLFIGFICSSVLRFIYFFCFSYLYVRQTKLAISLVNFWAHYKIVWLIDWLTANAEWKINIRKLNKGIVFIVAIPVFLVMHFHPGWREKSNSNDNRVCNTQAEYVC